ncbi:hypothetical protein [Streptomyces sp. NPDC001275]
MRVDKWPDHAQPSGSGSLSGAGRETAGAVDPGESPISGDALDTEPESGHRSEAAPESGDRGAWPDAAGRTAAWPTAGQDGARRRPQGAGEGRGPGSAEGSWFDKGRPAETAPAAETQVLPGSGPRADTWMTADPEAAAETRMLLGSAAETRLLPGSAAAAETQMLPGPVAAAETQVLPGASSVAAPGAPAGAGNGPVGTGPLRVQVEDPWETHDPHEVTVQLDAVSLRPGGTLGSAGPAGKEADRPVFVDESGRRSRRFRRLGMAIGLACAVYAVVIVVTLLSGNAAAPWVPVPVPGADDQPASKVKESPRQSDATSPSPETSGSPEAATDPSAPTVPSTDVNPPAGSTAVTGAPAVSGGTPAAPSNPAPSVSSTKKATPDRSVPPATGGNGSTPDPGPSSPEPGTSDPGQGPDPSPPGNSGGSGVTTNNNAGGAPKTNPVATGPAADRPGVTPNHSPENVL